MIAINKDIIATIGVDLGKNTFHICAMNDKGTILLRERLTRAALPKRLANIPPCRIGMEACAGSHHIGRQLTALGHDVRLMPAKYVKPFLKSHKNDYRDAEAIAEAVQRPTMRFVPFKSDEQLDLQALHRVRSRLVGQRTAVINQIRAFLLEHGVAVRQGPGALRLALPSILAQRTDVLSPRIIHLIEGLTGDWRRFDERIADVTREIEQLAKQDQCCKGLMAVPGVGPMTASAMVAAIGGGAAFSRGRDFAAWLGLVPKQISTGDRTILGGISRRGNRYLRTLFIQGARSVHLLTCRRQTGQRQRRFWLARRRMQGRFLEPKSEFAIAAVAWKRWCRRLAIGTVGGTGDLDMKMFGVTIPGTHLV